MNRDTLHNIFKSPYQSTIWKGFLKELFRDISSSYFETPVDLKDEALVKHKDVEHIWEFGDITLSDGRVIKFYEVELKENQEVTKNRVGLRNIVSGEIGFGYIDGAIITYYNKKSTDWRFTLISKSLYWDADNNEVKTETHPKRYTYLLGQNETVKTALNQFEWLFKQIKTRGIDLEDILKAFSVEKLSKEFYDGYFHQYETFVGYIVDNPKAFNHFLIQVSSSSSPEDKHKKAEHLVSDFVKKFLGRFVFLFFLQKKGWMGVPLDKDWGDGQLDFLFRLFEEFPDKNNFYEKALAPLFFRTLNVDRSDNNDIFSVTNTRIPYLNGGLFEKDETEPENIQFESQRFIDLFAFFSQYNFTVDESSPDDQDIGVDPEMLGHIFENLLEDNKDKGAFYTPKEIVHYMTQESLIEYLQTHLKDTSKEDLTIFVKQKKQGKLNENELEEINSLLSKVKILDPAIGSGAFPMGLLHEIFALKGLIAFEQGYEAWSPARVKERIIENSIYGVDIEEGAVDIARLRFWLSLVVDEPTPRPLPNLDYKIICGNSLISRYSLDTPINEVFKEFNKGRSEEEKVDLAKYKALVNDYMHEANYDKKEEFKQIIEDVKNTFKDFFTGKELKKLQDKRSELHLYDSNNLFGSNKNAAEKRRIKKLKTEITKLEEEKKEREEAKLFQNAVEWRFEFPNLLDKEGHFEGFDIVIGNPPYGAKVDEIKTLKNIYKETSFGESETYKYFINRGIRLCSNSGIFSYITSNSFLQKENYKDVREFIIKNTKTCKNINLGDGIFNNVNLPVSIIVANISINDTSIINYADVSKFERGNKIKNIHFDIIDYDIDTLEFNQKKKVITAKDVIALEKIYDQVMGVKVYQRGKGKPKQSDIERENNVFILSEKTSNNHIKFIDKGIVRYNYKDNSKFINYGEWLAEPRKLKYFTNPKIVIREVVNPSIYAHFVEFDAIVKNTNAVIISKDSNYSLKYLLALLNSKLFTFYLNATSSKSKNKSFPSFSSRLIKQMPIKILKPRRQEIFSSLVDYILTLNQELEQLNEFVPNSHIAETFEEVIDAMVFELYFPEEFEKVGILFIKYAERDFESVENKTSEEQKEIIHNAYQKLREKDNEIRNNLKEMKIELRDLLMPILTV